MNFTDNYIERVINNTDIQELCKYKNGDWFYNGKEAVLYYKNDLENFNPKEYAWLPNFEDLWGILHKCVQKDKNSPPIKWGESINRFILLSLGKESISIHSKFLIDIKDFILYYIMKNVYKKCWDEDKKQWIKIK